MTRLEVVFDELRKLPESRQDEIADLLLAQLEDDRAWDESFARSQDLLSELAARARQDVAAGRFRDLKSGR